MCFLQNIYSACLLWFFCKCISVFVYHSFSLSVGRVNTIFCRNRQYATVEQLAQLNSIEMQSEVWKLRRFLRDFMDSDLLFSQICNCAYCLLVKWIISGERITDSIFSILSYVTFIYITQNIVPVLSGLFQLSQLFRKSSPLPLIR